MVSSCMIRALRAQVYTGFIDMKVSTLKAISPADGRYFDKVGDLREIFSEFGLIRHRVLVEVRWLQCLSDAADVPELAPLTSVMKDVLNHIVDDFSIDDAERVKTIEAADKMCPRQTRLEPGPRRHVAIEIDGCKLEVDVAVNLDLAVDRRKGDPGVGEQGVLRDL